jgi:hypothetical protein
MLTALILLLAATAATQTPAATPTPAPVTTTANGQTRTLADVARERKLGKKGVTGGTLSVAGAAGSPAAVSGEAAKPTSDAEARLARAIERGTWVDQNIHYNEAIREQARRDWDSAAENCRATPGCTPVYRENAQINGVKPLRTGNEEARDLQKKRGADVDTPGR